jgi:hypothetical protein
VMKMEKVVTPWKVAKEFSVDGGAPPTFLLISHHRSVRAHAAPPPVQTTLLLCSLHSRAPKGGKG